MIGVDDVLAVHSHRQLGPHRARTDTVGADAIFAQFRCLLFGQLDHGGFGRAISHPQRRGPQARDRGDIQQRPFGHFQCRDQRLRYQKHAVQIGFHHTPPAGEIGFLDGPEIGHTCIVHNRIDTSVDRHRLGRHVVNGLRIRHVADDCCGIVQCRSFALQNVCIAVDHDDRPACLKKQFCCRQTNPTGRARHQCGFLFHSIPHSSLGPDRRLSRDKRKGLCRKRTQTDGAEVRLNAKMQQKTSILMRCRA